LRRCCGNEARIEGRSLREGRQTKAKIFGNLMAPLFVFLTLN